MEPIFIGQYESRYWRLRRERRRLGHGSVPYGVQPGYFVAGRHRPTPSEIKKLIQETVRYLAWRQSMSFASDRAVEAHDCRDLIERVRAGGWITPDDSEMPQSDSDDSYENFLRRGRAWDEGRRERARQLRAEKWRRDVERFRAMGSTRVTNGEGVR